MIEKASEEGKEANKLMQTTDSELEDDIIKKIRGKSADLLKRDLEKHKAGSRDYLYKVNMAMSVLYARQLLTSLLAYWPDSGHVISDGLLGCQNIQQIPCVIDLLNKIDNKDDFQKVSFLNLFDVFILNQTNIKEVLDVKFEIFCY